MVNQNMEASDQSAYMHYAQRLRASHFQYVGDRNRMPVYPAFMALFYQEGMTDQELFEVGKRVGIAIAIAVLGVSLFIMLRYVSSLDGLTAVLVAAFTVLAYKAPYFQADVLFYGIDFALFVLMLELIVRPTLLRALAVGLVGGFAHLTKASVLPRTHVVLGVGMVVLGIASVIIGESLVGTRAVGLLITGTVMGSVFFRLLVAVALRWGLNPNDLKLITALFVFAALVMPNLARRLRIRRPAVAKTAEAYAAGINRISKRSTPARPTRCTRSVTSRWRCPRAHSSSCWVPMARENPRCSTPSPAPSLLTRAPSASRGTTSHAGRSIAARA